MHSKGGKTDLLCARRARESSQNRARLLIQAQSALQRASARTENDVRLVKHGQQVVVANRAPLAAVDHRQVHLRKVARFVAHERNVM